jgi:serine/threonine kinase 38
LKQQQYSEDEKRRIIEESEQRERDYTRLQRQRLSIADFEALTIIGRGAFGEVRHLRILGFLNRTGMLNRFGAPSW